MRRIIVHPKQKPGTTKKFKLVAPPTLHMQVHMEMMSRKPLLCYQIYTFAEYNLPDKKPCWRGVCICGANWLGSIERVKAKMQEHIGMSGHDPGAVYTYPGRDEWLQARRAKEKAKHGTRTSSVRKASR